MTPTIEYNSIPVYSYSYLFSNVPVNVAVFTDSFRDLPAWTCSDWILFYDKLVKKYGAEKGKQYWSWWWTLGLSKSSGGQGSPVAGSGFVHDSIDLDCRSFNMDFRKFMEKNKLQDVIYKGIGNIARPIGVGAEIVSDTVDAVGNTAKTLKYVLPIVLIGFGTIALVWGYNKFIK